MSEERNRKKDAAVFLGYEALDLDRRPPVAPVLPPKLPKIQITEEEQPETLRQYQQPRQLQKPQQKNLAQKKSHFKINKTASLNQQIFSLGNGTRKKTSQKAQEKIENPYENHNRQEIQAQNQYGNDQQISGRKRKKESSGGMKMLKRMGKIAAYGSMAMGLISLAAGQASAKAIIAFIDLI